MKPQTGTITEYVPEQQVQTDVTTPKRPCPVCHEATMNDIGGAALLEAATEYGVNQERDRLRAALEMVEWEWGAERVYEELSHCPWCGNLKEDGHTPGCPRQIALGKEKP